MIFVPKNQLTIEQKNYQGILEHLIYVKANDEEIEDTEYFPGDYSENLDDRYKPESRYVLKKNAQTSVRLGQCRIFYRNKKKKKKKRFG